MFRLSICENIEKLYFVQQSYTLTLKSLNYGLEMELKCFPETETQSNSST